MKLNSTLLAAFFIAMPLSSNAILSEPIAYEAAAEDAPTHFILYFRDGEKVSFLLEHNPRVVSGEGIVTVVDEDFSVEYKHSEIHRYVIGTDDAYTSIGEVAGKSEGIISNQPGTIMLSGFKSHVPVIISDINGTIMLKSETDAEGMLGISTASYPSGIYIVKINNQTLKFIKR